MSATQGQQLVALANSTDGIAKNEAAIANPAQNAEIPADDTANKAQVAAEKTKTGENVMRNSMISNRTCRNTGLICCTTRIKCKYD